MQEVLAQLQEDPGCISRLAKLLDLNEAPTGGFASRSQPRSSPPPQVYVDAARVVASDMRVGTHTVHVLNKVLLRAKLGSEPFDHSAARGYSP